MLQPENKDLDIQTVEMLSYESIFNLQAEIESLSIEEHKLDEKIRLFE